MFTMFTPGWLSGNLQLCQKMGIDANNIWMFTLCSLVNLVQEGELPQLFLTNVMFLAVKNSSIGDLVTDSLTEDFST